MEDSFEYPKLFVHVCNLADPIQLRQFLDAYCVSELIEIHRYVGVDNPLGAPYRKFSGVDTVASFWESIFVTTPDHVICLTGNVQKVCLDNDSFVLEVHFDTKSTRLMDMSVVSISPASDAALNSDAENSVNILATNVASSNTTHDVDVIICQSVLSFYNTLPFDDALQTFEELNGSCKKQRKSVNKLMSHVPFVNLSYFSSEYRIKSSSIPSLLEQQAYPAIAFPQEIEDREYLDYLLLSDVESDDGIDVNKKEQVVMHENEMNHMQKRGEINEMPIAQNTDLCDVFPSAHTQFPATLYTGEPTVFTKGTTFESGQLLQKAYTIRLTGVLKLHVSKYSNRGSSGINANITPNNNTILDMNINVCGSGKVRALFDSSVLQKQSTADTSALYTQFKITMIEFVKYTQTYEILDRGSV